MMQPGFAAIGPSGTYGSSFGSNGAGNGNGSHDGGSNDGSMANQQNGVGPHDNGGQQGAHLQQPEYTLAGILHFLQSEWRRYERDRNEWEIERAEMRARVALLEGERRSAENLKTDLMRRVKMLEFALRQERSKYLASGSTQQGSAQSGNAVHPKHAALQGLDKASTSSGRSSPAQDASTAPEHGNAATQRGQSTISTHAFNTLNTSTINGLSIGGPGSTTGGLGASLARQGSSAKDPKARAKSREYLKQCLQEISYLTSASTLNPLPERAASNSLLGAGHFRPRKIMPENVPPAFPGGASAGDGQGTMTAAARRQRSLDRGAGLGTTGKASGARGVQPFGEPLVEREEEGMTGEVEGNTTGTEPYQGANAVSEPADNTAAVEGLALDKGSMRTTKDGSGSEGSSASAESLPSSRAPSGELEDTLQSSDEEVMRVIADEEEREPITAVYRPGAGGQEGIDDWARLKEAGRIEREKREKERCAVATAAGETVGDASPASQASELQTTSDRVQELMRANAAKSGSSPSGLKAEEDDLASLTLTGDTDEEASRIADEAAAESQMWKSKRVLRGHLDSVRAVAFDTSDLGLYSGSDDGTIKYWRIDAASLKQGKPAAPAGGSEGDPLATLRGHSGGITCLALSASKQRLYSGSVDSSIVVWKLLDSKSVEPYPPFDKDAEVARLVGHTQPIWDLCILPTKGDDEGLLASASADGTVKVWSTQDSQGSAGGNLFITFDYFGLEPKAESEKEREALLAKSDGSLPVPTSVAPCMSDLRRCAVSYSNAVVKLFEVQTGREVMQFASDAHYDGSQATQVNKVITHPTLPILITGHENNYIQFFDINTGACTLSMVAHLDSVTSLDIDPSGLTLVSGGHDCSVRFWDIVSSTSDSNKVSGAGDDASGGNDANAAMCVQEITAHRKKSFEGVLVVKYHPNAPWFCSAGADGVIRIYG